MKAFKKIIKVKKSELESFGESLEEQIELYCGERFRASGLFFHIDSITEMDDFLEIELELRQIIPTECIKTIKIPNKYLTHLQVGELIDVTLYSMILSQIHGGCDFVILDKNFLDYEGEQLRTIHNVKKLLLVQFLHTLLQA